MYFFIDFQSIQDHLSTIVNEEMPSLKQCLNTVIEKTLQPVKNKEKVSMFSLGCYY